VLHVTKDRIDDVGVLHQVAAYIGELPAEQHSDPAVISVIKRALEGAAAKDAPADVSYLTAGLLRVAVSSAGQGEARRWLGILAAKLRAACGRFPGELRVLQKVDTLTLNPDGHAFDQLVAAVRDVARLAADQDMPTSERIGMLATLPSPLAGRLIAQHLIETLDADVERPDIAPATAPVAAGTTGADYTMRRVGPGLLRQHVAGRRAARTQGSASARLWSALDCQAWSSRPPASPAALRTWTRRTPPLCAIPAGPVPTNDTNKTQKAPSRHLPRDSDLA
jgi:hypothetical protein